MSQLLMHIRTNGATGEVCGQTANTGEHFYPFTPNRGGTGTGINQGVVVSGGYIVNVNFQDGWRAGSGTPVANNPGNGDFNGGSVAIGYFNHKGTFIACLKSAGY